MPRTKIRPTRIQALKRGANKYFNAKIGKWVKIKGK